MKLAQHLPTNGGPHQIVPYQTWGYFVKDLSDAHQMKMAKLAIWMGGAFFLQTLSLLILGIVGGNSRLVKSLTWSSSILLLMIMLMSLVVVGFMIRRLFKKKAIWVAISALVSEVVLSLMFVPLFKAMGYQSLFFILLLGVPVSFFCYGVIQIVLTKRGAPLLTDQEFDAWVEQRARVGLMSTIHSLGLADEIRNINDLLCVRGYVLSGMRNARYYNHSDLLSRLGADGKWRYSVNIYTYFYPAEHQIMIFIYDINAMNWADYREATKEYFYQDVIGATTEDEQDTISINGKLFNYRDQRFSLRLCDGYGVGATVRSVPLDNIAGLPTFDMPNSGVDSTIAQLRMLLRTKKWRT